MATFWRVPNFAGATTSGFVLLVRDRRADQVLRRALELVVEGEPVDEPRVARLLGERHPVLGSRAHLLERQVAA